MNFPQVQSDDNWVDAPLAGGRNSSGGPRRFNLKLAIITIVILGPCAVGAHFWQKRQLTKHSTAFLARANVAEKAGEWNSAAKSLRKYLQYFPDDIKRRERLAGLMEKAADSPRDLLRVSEELGRCLSYDPSRTDLRLRIAALVHVISPRRALREVDLVLRTDPKHADALYIRAMALHEIPEDERYNGSPIWLEQVKADERRLAVAPTDIQASDRLADLYQRHALELGNRREKKEQDIRQMADQVMDQVVQNCDGSVESRLARHGYRRKYGLSQQVFGFDEDLRVVLQKAPKNPIALFAAGVHFAKQATVGEQVDSERMAQAREYLNRAIAAGNTDGEFDHRPYLALCNVESDLGNMDAAINVLTQGLEDVEGNIHLLLRLAELQIDAKKFVDANVTLRKLERQIELLAMIEHSPVERREYFQRKAYAEIVRTRWHLAEGNEYGDRTIAAETVAALEPKVIVGENAELILTWLGYNAIVLENWKKALDALRAAVVTSPTSIRPRIRLAKLYKAREMYAEAIREYRDLLRYRLPLQFEVFARTEMTRLLADEQRAKFRSERDWAKCTDSLQKLKRIAGSQPEVIVLDLQIAYSRAPIGRYADILTALKKLEMTFGDSHVFWRGAAGLYWQLGQPALARSAMSRLEQLGRKTDAATPPAKQNELNANIAGAEQAAHEGDFERALALLKPLSTGDRLTPWLMRLQWAVQRSRIEELKELQSEIPADQQDSPLGRLVRAYGLMLDDTTPEKLAQADVLLKQLTDERGDSVQVQLAQARLAELRDQLVTTLSHYKAVYDQGYRSRWLTSRIVSLLIIVGRHNEAWAFLQKLERDEWYQPALLPMVIQAGVLTGNATTAVHFARQAIQETPGAPEGRVALAFALLAVGSENYAEAREMINDAVRSAPNHPGLWVAQLAFDLRAGDTAFVLYRDAARLVALLRAHGDQLSPAWQRYIAARLNAFVGNASGADEYYRQAFVLDENLRKFTPLGTPLTQRVVSRNVAEASKITSVDPAAPILGLLLAAMGDETQAKPLVARNPAVELVSRLLHGGEDEWLKVEQELKARGRRLGLDDLRLLAHMARLRGDGKMELEYYRQLAPLVRRPDDFVAYATFIVREKLKDDAQRVLELMTQQGRRGDRHQVLRLRLFALAHPEQAQQLAEREQRELDGDARLLFLRFLAVSLAKEDHGAEALAILDEYFQGKDLAVLRLECAGYLGDSQPILDALAKMGDDFPEEASLSAMILWSLRNRSTTLDKTISPLVAKLVENDRSKASAQLLSSVAAWCELKGETPRSMELTQAALKAAPDDFIHRNNLAWSLATYASKPDVALTLLDTLIREAGPHAQLLDTKGIALYQLKRYREAASYLRSSWDGGEAAAQLHLAAVMDKLNHTELAKKLFSEYRRRGKPANPFDEGLAKTLLRFEAAAK